MLAADPRPAVQEGALSDSHISFGFIYILCQNLRPPGCQTPRSHGGGVREQRRPLLLQIPVRTFPSPWELGSDPIQGTARAQAAIGGPPTQLRIPGDRSGRGRSGLRLFRIPPPSHRRHGRPLLVGPQRTNIYQSVTCYALLTNTTSH